MQLQQQQEAVLKKLNEEKPIKIVNSTDYHFNNFYANRTLQYNHDSPKPFWETTFNFQGSTSARVKVSWRETGKFRWVIAGALNGDVERDSTVRFASSAKVAHPKDVTMWQYLKKGIDGEYSPRDARDLEIKVV